VTSKTFCVLPWLHAATLTDGSVQLCCVSAGGSGFNLNQQTLADYWNSEYVRDTRRRMLAGESVKACQRCYDEEAHGYKSHRLVEHEAWQARCGKDTIRNLIEQPGPDGSLAAGVQHIDLRLGNTCNMTCIMCQPRESSRWVPAARRLSTLVRDNQLKHEWRFKSLIEARRFEWYRNAAFWENLKSFLPHVKEIILAGGEPFLIKEQFDFVKTCCEIGEAHHIRLRYHTNGTVFPKEMIGYWEQFERVHFMVSLDGIGEAANYVRYPTNWKELENNIRCFDGLGKNSLTSFNFTTHALNAYRIPEVLDWADNSGLTNRRRFPHMQGFVAVSLVQDPSYQTICVLPPDCKQLIGDRLSGYIRERLAGQNVTNLHAMLAFMNSQDNSRKMSTLVEYTRILDRTRGTDFSRTFPELAPYWTRYEKIGG